MNQTYKRDSVPHAQFTLLFASSPSKQKFKKTEEKKAEREREKERSCNLEGKKPIKKVALSYSLGRKPC